jgi:crotonobetainyl-CoA:carnitine CoA-transferase CaiB-like acyl-CoA transferase
MGDSDLATDTRFSTAEARIANAAELLSLVEEWMQGFGSDAELLSYLEDQRIPAAPVLSPEEAMVHPHFTERGMVRTVVDPAFGEITVTGLPARFSSIEIPASEPLPPFLGQHNAEVLSEILGMSDSAISELEHRGVLLSGADGIPE